MDIREQLERDEGNRLVMYSDSFGWMSNGIGHNFGTKDPNQVPENMRVISENQRDALFDADLHHTWDLLDIYIPWWAALDGNNGPRSNVIVNGAFNLGIAGLAMFHGFLGFMKNHLWAQAATDLRATLVYRQLPARYERLCQQIITGIWK